MDSAKFRQLLESILEPDTARIKEATAILKRDFYTSPDSLAFLFQLLTSDEAPPLRQLAGVQVRPLVRKHWNQVPASHKPQIRSHLLSSTLNEANTNVRHASARVITAVAKVDLVDGEWADLPGQMMKAAASSNVKEREVSTYILLTILEDMAAEHTEIFPSLFQLFSKTIHDPESAEVRINTLVALTKMAVELDSDDDQKSIDAFQKLFPDMVGILKQAIDAKDEDRMLQCFECVQTLLECDPQLLNKHFRDLVQFIVGIAFDNDAEKETRVQCLNVLIGIIVYRKLKFQGLRIANQVAKSLVEVLVTDEDDGDELGLYLAALSLFHYMSTALPPSQVVAPLVELFKSLSGHPEWRYRQGILNSLTACVDGAADFLDTQLPVIIPNLLKLLRDPEIKVRHSAVNAVKEFAESLPESLAKEHENFLSALAQNLGASVQNVDASNDPSKSLNSKIAVDCCVAIDSLANGLSKDEISVYLPEFIPHLIELTSHPLTSLKSASVGALGSIAGSAKDAFLPYHEQTMNALSRYFMIKDDDEELKLRAISCDAAGQIAEGIGADAFQQYVVPLMEATNEGIHLDNANLAETSFLLWGSLARTYKEKFSPFLEGIVTEVFKALEQAEADLEVALGATAKDLVGQQVVIGGKKIKVVSGDPDEDAAIDEAFISDGFGDGDDDDSDWDDFAAVSEIAEEKRYALDCLGDLISHSGRTFIPYFEKSLELVMSNVEHPYDPTRCAAISTMFRAYASVWQLQDESAQKFEPGLPLKSQPSQEIMNVAELVMTATLSTWSTEEECAIVVEINEGLASTLKLCGPAIVSGKDVLTQVTQNTIQLLTGQHPCQQDIEEDEEDLDEEEGSEEAWSVIESALDLVAGLAPAFGPQFAELWKIFEKPVIQYASDTEATHRSVTIGTIADSMKGMKSGVTGYTTGLLKLLLHRLSDEDGQTKSNAAYGVGVLIENTEKHDEVKKAYPTILSKLEPLLHSEGARQLDNAAGCVARMISKHPESVPIEQVLPALVNLLPLREDYEENEPVYAMIVKLYQSGDSTIQNLSPQLMPIIASVISKHDEQLEPETLEQLTQLVKYIHSKQPALVSNNEVLMKVVQS